MSLLVLALVGAGCDALGDDAAAVVDGREITIDQVRALSEALNDLPNAVPVVVEDQGRLDGTLARRSLTGLVGLAVAQSALRALGAEPSAEDAAAVEAQMQNFSSAPDDVRATLRAGFEATVALDRVISEHWSSALGRAVLDRIAEDLGEGPPPLCVDGWVGAAESADDALEIVEGATVDPTADLEAIGFSALGRDTERRCFEDAELESIPAEVTQAFEADPSDEFRSVTFDDPSAGPTAVVFRPIGRQALPARDSDEFKTAAEEYLRQIYQQGGGLTARVALDLADIVIDSRFGSGLDEDFVVIPPAAPLQPRPQSVPELVVPGTDPSTSAGG